MIFGIIIIAVGEVVPYLLPLAFNLPPNIGYALRFILLSVLPIPGIVLLVLGIREKVIKNKERARSQDLQVHQGLGDEAQFEGKCIYCNNKIIAMNSDFQWHRNYPEGYVYCRFCKKPLSKNLFSIVQH